MREHELQQRILNTYGALPFLRIARQNRGVAVAQDRSRVVTFGAWPGCSDIIGVLRLEPPFVPRVVGQWFACEVKSPDGRLSPDQEAFKLMMLTMGAAYCNAAGKSREEGLSTVAACLLEATPTSYHLAVQRAYQLGLEAK